MAREGVPLVVIQRQLGHSNLGITSVYLQGIDNAKIIETVHARRAPMIPVTASSLSSLARRAQASRFAHGDCTSHLARLGARRPLGLPGQPERGGTLAA
jgi:hypothetical protein